MPRCFVPGCKSGYDSVLPSCEKRHFFRPPRDAERLALWQRAVPRQDKKLSSTCSVCDLHFSDEDISKVFEHNICGELVTMPTPDQMSDQTPDQMSDEQSYFRGSPDDRVVYYLAGYVVHKMTKRKECQLCLQDVSSEAPVIGSDAYLTTYRSFKEGSLRHPSIKMLHFIRVVNESISFSLDVEGLCADLFWKVLDELDECDLTRLGCDQHKSTFTCQSQPIFHKVHIIGTGESATLSDFGQDNLFGVSCGSCVQQAFQLTAQNMLAMKFYEVLWTCRGPPPKLSQEDVRNPPELLEPATQVHHHATREYGGSFRICSSPDFSNAITSLMEECKGRGHSLLHSHLRKFECPTACQNVPTSIQHILSSRVSRISFPDANK
ncbi:hypothetical protein HPB51_014809 [Rhipicephalus microplus]|uniref:THAP-type domain-containing protein n=1 Tax=Rhipicephalus microplus TaxID=6941 RepID=A0A9J6DNT2_RHIMP|nr:hypothetical protein HPB51_014809 [Rhipicephalus microplus]